jgi:hypothetical protein
VRRRGNPSFSSGEAEEQCKANSPSPARNVVTCDENGLKSRKATHIGFPSCAVTDTLPSCSTCRKNVRTSWTGWTNLLRQGFAASGGGNSELDKLTAATTAERKHYDTRCDAAVKTSGQAGQSGQTHCAKGLRRPEARIRNWTNRTNSPAAILMPRHRALQEYGGCTRVFARIPEFQTWVGA